MDGILLAISVNVTIIPRGPRGTVDGHGWKVLLIVGQLVGIRHCACRCAVPSVYSEYCYANTLYYKYNNTLMVEPCQVKDEGRVSDRQDVV